MAVLNPRHAGPRIPSAIRLEELEAVIFDMDGVVTDTAAIHAAAWKRLFDGYLRERSRRTGEPFRPFDIDRDYRRYVDGKPRSEGVRDFLGSRGVVLSEGDPDDPPDRETVRGLGNSKDRYFLEHIKEDRVQPYTGTVHLVRSLQAAGVGTAIISASRNLVEVLDAAGIPDLFSVRVDGVESDRLGLKGKPDPAIFLEAARRLGVEPPRAAIVEDALAGRAQAAVTPVSGTATMLRDEPERRFSDDNRTRSQLSRVEPLPVGQRRSSPRGAGCLPLEPGQLGGRSG